MPYSTLLKLGQYLHSRKNFLAYSVIGMGVPISVILILVLDRFQNVGFSLFLIIVSFLGSYIWGVVMWKFVLKKLMKHDEER
jgi:hypothetical protein